MNKYLIALSLSLFLGTLGYSTDTFAHATDDPLLAKIMIDQLEWHSSGPENFYTLDAQGWLGKDLHKLWFKTDVKQAGGHVQEAEVQALYSRAIAPFWDLQVGVRQDLKPTPDHLWGVIGIQGLAPYFFELDAALFIDESGASAARFSVDYELMFTQKLVLTPQLSLNFYGQNDQARFIGSGLSDAQADLRLRYEFRRELAPYVGASWTRRFSNSADFARENKQEISGYEWLIGLRVWF